MPVAVIVVFVRRTTAEVFAGMAAGETAVQAGMLAAQHSVLGELVGAEWPRALLSEHAGTL